jgi:hypothetical protein
MRLLVALTVLGLGIYLAAPVTRLTGVSSIHYLLIVVVAACVAPVFVRSWERRHPDRCAYCHGHGSTTFIADRRLRTRRCFVCDGTGQRSNETS